MSATDNPNKPTTNPAKNVTTTTLSTVKIMKALPEPLPDACPEPYPAYFQECIPEYSYRKLTFVKTIKIVTIHKK